MFGDLMGAAAKLLQNNSAEDVAGAAADHVEATDADTVADHLAQGAGNMDRGSLAQLGQSLLGALASRGHDEGAVQDAGIATDAAASGDSGNVMALIEHARDNPAALKDAAVDFIQKNPQALGQLPGMLQGILGRLGG